MLERHLRPFFKFGRILIDKLPSLNGAVLDPGKPFCVIGNSLLNHPSTAAETEWTGLRSCAVKCAESSWLGAHMNAHGSSVPPMRILL